jgi:L-iditol 2-dehydrogenase
MKAFVYSGGKDLRIKEVPTPKLPEKGALAKVLYTSICGTDLRTYRFGSNHIVPPRIIGHEAIYQLEWVSEEFSNTFHPGDKVLVAPAIGCGQCKSCLQGKTNRCTTLKTIGFDYDGPFTEYMVIPRQAFLMGNVVKITAEDPGMEFSVVEPIACAINGQNFLSISPGENVLIFGAGFLGSIHAELALLKGVNKVIIAEVSEKKRRMAKDALPEAIVVDSNKKEIEDVIANELMGEGIDVAITACPAGITHKLALELINHGGRVSLFGGLPAESVGFLDSNLIHYKELGVFGVHGSSPAHNRLALEYIQSGKLDAAKYLSVFPFSDVEHAFEKLDDESIVKAVLKL